MKNSILFMFQKLKDEKNQIIFLYLKLHIMGAEGIRQSHTQTRFEHVYHYP